MPLPSPNLDDRDFNTLVEEARRRIQQTCPDWTDLSPSDPGMVLLELFAHLTETMIYRLNRLPEKAYIEFLNLMGVRVHPPTAAAVTLRFTHSGPFEQPIEIPRGARVTVNRVDGTGEPPVFTTDRTVTLRPVQEGESMVEVSAHHCTLVEGELAGVGTGVAGLVVRAKRPPLTAPTGDDLDLIVGVETETIDEWAPAIRYEDKVYRIWRAVDHFANLGSDGFVYTVDRLSGEITFAPAARIASPDGALNERPRALGEIPQAGKEIRLWYRRGGGPEGNVAAHTLTVFKDPIPGVEVTNPEPATGGQAAETLENALIRGPQEMHSLQRAVTARDFESIALQSSPAIARAKAITQAALWAYATPGAVEVLLVPYLPEDQRGAGQVTVAALRTHETEIARREIQKTLDERRPLGASCVVNWTHYKPVNVTARMVVRRQEDRAAIRQRVIERLHGAINPLPTRFSATGWPFGQALRASHIYEIALAEPGVLWVDDVQLEVTDAPNKDVATLIADPFQPSTWYAASGGRLFRSLNDGDGWEMMCAFPGERITEMAVHPDQAGLLAVITTLANEESSRIHISTDCGESWSETPITTAFEINDLAWAQRGETPVLFLATDVGLYELSMETGGTPIQVLVDLQDQNLGFYAVATSRDIRGQVSVAVAARNTDGVYLSAQGGRRNTFRRIGLKGEDIRVLAVQYDGPRSYLWAGVAAAGGEDPGKGCYRWELLGSQDPPEGWIAFSKGWQGGSCHDIAFAGEKVWAASHRSGVLQLDIGHKEPQWRASDVRCGLPLRDPGRFQPVATVAATNVDLVMAGGVEGVFRSKDGGATYGVISDKIFSDKVTLPPTWLFCSGDHEISIVSEDETK